MRIDGLEYVQSVNGDWFHAINGRPCYGLDPYQAELLTRDPAKADFFEACMGFPDAWHERLKKNE